MHKTSILLILIIIAMTTGCSTNPYNTPINNKGMAITQNATMGAVGGAAAGVIIGDSRKSSSIGAGLGALLMGG